MSFLATAEHIPANDGLTTLLVLAAVVAAGYVLSLALHPLTHCRRCDGTPRQYGAVSTHAFRLCSSCGGSGRERRLGARMLGIGDN
jgi:DnaJ-class molecular chaperone